MAEPVPVPSPLLQSENSFREAIRTQSRFVHFLAILGVPAVVGIWLSVVDPAKIGSVAFWMVTVMLILLQVVLYFVTTAYADTLPELHLERVGLQEENEAMIEDIEEADSYIQWLETANRLGGYWSTFQGLLDIIRPEEDDGVSEACRIAISPMIEAAGILFNFGFGEAWSVAVYQLGDRGDLLVPVWWKRAEDHPSQGTPRSWRPGDGHVGSAFMQDRILFTTDMTSEEASMLLKPSVANGRQYDDSVYRSFVSAPILLDAEPHPVRFGVLVITSDVAGRFDEDNRTVVAHAAQVLAHLFNWRRLANTTTTY